VLLLSGWTGTSLRGGEWPAENIVCVKEGNAEGLIRGVVWFQNKTNYSVEEKGGGGKLALLMKIYEGAGICW